MQLASNPVLSQPPLAAMPQLSEKPRMGFATKKTTGKPESSVCKFTVTLGLQVVVNENGVRKTYRARYYNPQAGRFLSEDPLGFNGEDINMYAYVDDNPTSWIDPTGLIHQEWDGRLHDNPQGGLEVLCTGTRNTAQDIGMLEWSISVRTAELLRFGNEADEGHIDRVFQETATLQRCQQKKCDQKKSMSQEFVDQIYNELSTLWKQLNKPIPPMKYPTFFPPGRLPIWEY